jgi:pimeloyl-ACP methyl ester carboxylesterase
LSKARINDIDIYYETHGERRHAYMNQINAIYAFDAYDRLPQITAPSLVLTGADDVLIPPANSHTLAARTPNARLIEFDRAGHLYLY